MLQALVLVILGLAGAGALYLFWRLLQGFGRRADEVEERSAPTPRSAPRQAGEPLGPDGLVYLCAHDFVPPGAPRNVTNVRRRVFAPLTGDELEPRRVAEQIVYAVLVSLLEAGRLDLFVAECEPNFMPPYPHKRWTLHAVRLSRLVGCPLAEALDCAFDVVEPRVARRGKSVEDGIPLDELIEDMLKVMRQEMSFWDRAGVYADIRQYLEAALLDQGYLLAPARETWLERLRHLRPEVNQEAVPYLETASAELAERLRAFRQTHGSPTAGRAESVPGGRTEEVDESLAEAAPPFEDLPLHDCLRISIHEALLAIRQLEPSEDVGV